MFIDMAQSYGTWVYFPGKELGSATHTAQGVHHLYKGLLQNKNWKLFAFHHFL